MSFSFKIKTEFCKRPLEDPCCLIAEAFGVLLFCSSFNWQQIRISTTCPDFAKRLPLLFQKAFGLTFDTVPENFEGKKFLYLMEDKEKIQQIFQILDYTADQLACHINFSFVEKPCCLRAFVQGAFLAGGSATDPEKSYHLEFSTCHNGLGKELSALFHETPFQPKIAQRKGHSLCYFKQYPAIYGFLSTFGAENAARELEEISRQKHLTTSVNRQVNCDAANLEKSVNAAQEQIQAIRKLENQGLLDGLPMKLQETARLRCENPDCTLSQLADFFTPPLSKSALNHRLRKLIAMVE
ncbi:MAG: DNA-binding protein WhiA [Eubacteriales bacterium]